MGHTIQHTFEAQVQAEYGQDLAGEVIEEARGITFGVLLRRPWMRDHRNERTAEDTIKSVTCDLLLALSMGATMEEARLEAVRQGDHLLRYEYNEDGMLQQQHLRLDHPQVDIGVEIDFDQMEHSEAGINAFDILNDLATPRQAEIVTALASTGPTEVGEMFGITKQSVISARNQVRAKFIQREEAIT